MSSDKPIILVMQLGLNDGVGKGFRKIFRSFGADAEIVKVAAGERFLRPTLEDYDGILLTGSASMVTERNPWSVQLEETLRPLVSKGVTPILGVCYGHQLLIESQYGVVGYAPKRQIGSKLCHLTTEAADDDLFRVFNKRSLMVQVLHRQRAYVIPNTAVILAHNDSDKYHALRIGPKCWSVQFHPEMDFDTMNVVVNFNKPTLHKDGLEFHEVIASVQDSSDGLVLLRQFTEICRHSYGAKAKL